jgi:hypothetical protein
MDQIDTQSTSSSNAKTIPSSGATEDYSQKPVETDSQSTEPTLVATSTLNSQTPASVHAVAYSGDVTIKQEEVSIKTEHQETVQPNADNEDKGKHKKHKKEKSKKHKKEKHKHKHKSKHASNDDEKTAPGPDVSGIKIEQDQNVKQEPQVMNNFELQADIPVGRNFFLNILNLLGFNPF